MSLAKYSKYKWPHFMKVNHNQVQKTTNWIFCSKTEMNVSYVITTMHFVVFVVVTISIKQLVSKPVVFRNHLENQDIDIGLLPKHLEWQPALVNTLLSLFTHALDSPN